VSERGSAGRSEGEAGEESARHTKGDNGDFACEGGRIELKHRRLCRHGLQAPRRPTFSGNNARSTNGERNENPRPNR
jgi:hypothetical protein